MSSSVANASHGTHCAGIVAAQSKNSEGVASIAGANSHTQIMALRQEDDNGSILASASISCYEYLVRARAAGVNVVAVNCSWGALSSVYNPVMDYLINQAGKAGILSVFAAGNDSADVNQDNKIAMLQSPYLIEVASSNENGALSYFTCFNDTAIDVAAPGSKILSTFPNYSGATSFLPSLSYKAGKDTSAEGMLYYTDIASLSGLTYTLYDTSTNSTFTCDGAVTLSTVPNGLFDSDALKVTVDYDKIVASKHTPANVRVQLDWTIDNPFKQTTLEDTDPSHYAVGVATDVTDGLTGSQRVNVYEGLYSGNTNLVSKTSEGDETCASAIGDASWLNSGSLTSIDTTSDTLTAQLSVEFNNRKFNKKTDPTVQPSGTWSCLVTGYGIGKITDPTLDTETTAVKSAYVPYFYDSGTSMAAPMIAGSIGELAALHTDYTPLQLRGLICGGTKSLTGLTFDSKGDTQMHIASDGRFTFEAALDDSKVSANTWSITTSGDQVTLHGYNLEDATLYVDDTSHTTATTTAASPGGDTLTFTASSTLLDGKTHRFDVVDASTGRYYNASYVTPDAAQDSLTRVCDLPTYENADSASLVSTSDSLFYADGLGKYFYSCSDPTGSASQWTKLTEPGYPWTGTDNYKHENIEYTYANGKIYAMTTEHSTDENQYVAICNIYDISGASWSGWNTVAELDQESPINYDAFSCNGSVFFATYGEKTSYLLTCKPGETSFAKTSLTLPTGIPIFIYNTVGNTICGISPCQVASGNYGLGLATLNTDTSSISYVGVMNEYGEYDMYGSISAMSKIQTGAGNGFIVAGKSIEGFGDLQLISPEGTITKLGSYGLDDSSGFVTSSMAMYGGKLYLNCVDHSAGTDTVGLYTLPDSAASKVTTTDVTAGAQAESGGTATVGDWSNNAAASITMRSGDTATWTATPDANQTFTGWYDKDGKLVSSQPVYSQTVSSETLLTAHFSTEKVIRLSGSSALGTMSEIVDTGFTGTGGTVVLATLDAFPDALTASGIAGLANAPVLLTNSTTLSEQTSAELARLKPQTIIVCGGTGAVSEDVATAAKTAAGATNLYRCAGGSRSKTACEIYKNAKDYTGNSFSTTAFVTTGSNYADALAIAPYAYAKGCPVFLTESDGTLSSDTVTAMKEGGIKDFYVLGGTGAVSSSVLEQLADQGISFDGRLSGGDRYATCEKIAEFELANGLQADKLAIATGTNYKDALTGAAFCGRNKAVLLLVSDTNRTTIDSIATPNKNNISQAYIFGGTGAVSQETQTYLENALQ